MTTPAGTTTNGVDAAENNDYTPQEVALMRMYDTVKQYERTALRLREEAARAKLAARDAAFRQENEQKNAKRKKKKRKTTQPKNSAAAASEEDDDDQDEDELDSEADDNDDDEDISLHQRREETLAALREEVEQAKNKQQLLDGPSPEEDLREQLLETATTDGLMDVPSLKRKQRPVDDDDSKKPSLIDGLMAAATPPHEFSKSLGLVLGKTIFPDPNDSHNNKSAVAAKWTPPEGVFSPNDGAFVATLDQFDVAQAQVGRGNNTLAIKLRAPADSKRFSFNICAPDHDSFDSVLFHFNPRQHERGGQLVVNDKQDGVWGQAITIPLSQVPLLFGGGGGGQQQNQQASSTIMIQVHGDGFDVFVEGQHCARLEHRQDLATADHLVLQFPSTDDYGSPENWIVYKVWWGNRPIMAKGDVSGIAGVNQFNSMHPRKLFISSLPKIYTESDVDIRRAELERAFAKYGGDKGVVTVIAPTNASYAFVEMESERLCDLALQEMANGPYCLNRARRTRHEAILEERAAKGGAQLGQTKATGKKEAGAWD